MNQSSNVLDCTLKALFHNSYILVVYKFKSLLKHLYIAL